MVPSEEFSFPSLASQESLHHRGLDSPPLWKDHHKRGGFRRSLDDKNDLTKSFSYMETRSLWSDKEEEKMDILWEDLNEELKTRSQSLRIGEKTKESSAVAVGCGMKLSKKEKKSTNVLMLMRVLRKILALKSSSSQRSPVKTHFPL